MSQFNERLEEARQRVSDMITLAAALGAPIGLEEIRSAALVSLPPFGEFVAAELANCGLFSLEGVARILAGLGDDRVIARMSDEVDSTKMLPPGSLLPARRPRRDRAAERARRATKWLDGPAWRIVGDPNAPDQTEGP